MCVYFEYELWFNCHGVDYCIKLDIRELVHVFPMYICMSLCACVLLRLLAGG